jgi:hypothetical protein
MPTVHAPSHELAPRPRPLIRIDPGWLFLMAGLALVAATVLIPAGNDLEDARWERNKALAIERHRVQRLERYGQYLAAVHRGDEDVMLSLVATQLNMSPIERVPLMAVPDPLDTSASPFPALEPEPLVLPPKPRPDTAPSLLTRLTTDDRHRLWLIAAGVVCILIGVLPPLARPRMA